MGKGKHKYPFQNAMDKKDLLWLPKATIPEELLLKNNAGPRGFHIGGSDQFKEDSFVGMSTDEAGNIIVVGGNGSGKSSGIAKPTLITWPGPIFAIDVKGELSAAYADFFEASLRQGKMARPYIVCDPMNPEGPGYDPLWGLLEDESISNIWEIAHNIIPLQPEDNQPFWVETERSVLAAALHLFSNLELSFSQALCRIMDLSLTDLCQKLEENNDTFAKKAIGEMAKMKPETVACVDRGLRNKLMPFATDRPISHLFRGKREGADCFTWDDLKNYNIFLRIPEDKIEQWGPAVNLMQAQLIRYLERQPDRYSAAGADNPPILLLFDEFARLGKLEAIANALSTLRSKNVHIALMVQSVAQIDKIYGEKDRRIIFDNCQFQVFLRSNDADTQEYISKLIGTHIYSRNSINELWDASFRTTGYSEQQSEVREWLVHPHTLSALDDVLLLTPYGFYRVNKTKPYLDSDKMAEEVNDQDVATSTKSLADFWMSLFKNNRKENKGVVMMSIEERSQNASRRAEESKHKQRIAERGARNLQKKQDQRRNFILGEMVVEYFPELLAIEPSNNNVENAARFSEVKAFLKVLSSDHELVQRLKDRATQEAALSSDREPC